MRAQGAQLGEERGERLAVEAGYASSKAAVVSEVQEKLARKYSVSREGELAIIRACSGAAPIGAAPTASGEPSPSSKGFVAPKAGATLKDVVALLEPLGPVVVQTDLGPSSPRPLSALDREAIHVAFERDHWIFSISAGGDRCDGELLQIPSIDSGFILSTKVDLRMAESEGAARISWHGQVSQSTRLSGAVHFRWNGEIQYWESHVTGDSWKAAGSGKSATATFPNRREVGVTLRHREGKLDVWVDGKRAFQDVALTDIPIQGVALGACSHATAAFDDIVLAKLPR
ncbi:MAG: hypothetical protein HYZ29_12560 [Myxococcales bacterium]|nr:hypothetical protein [Myxococcales bacterium]